jgi:tetratricopeptide (TPR) repeat protein
MLHLVESNKGARDAGFTRHDVLRIVQISGHQLRGWERAQLVVPREKYSFVDIALLKTLRDLRAEGITIGKIRASIEAMQTVESVTDPLQETSVVRNGTGIAFRYNGCIVDPLRRQFVFDFEKIEPAKLRSISVKTTRKLQADNIGSKTNDERFFAAVQADEAGESDCAVALYHQILADDPTFAAAFINLGTIYFKAKDFKGAEEAFRGATLADPHYALGYFNLGTVLDEMKRYDEAIKAYTQALEISPRFADVHYNLAFAYQSTGEMRPALRHWREYTRLDNQSKWAENARKQIHNLLTDEFLSIAWRSTDHPPKKNPPTPLRLV